MNKGVKKITNKELAVAVISVMCMSNMMLADLLPLPALPAITDYFGVSADMVQLTISASMLGGALFGMFHGPMADLYGRKKILVINLYLYSAVCFACIFATSIEQLIALRFAQAATGCSTTIIAYALMNDMFRGRRSTQMISRIVLATFAARFAGPIFGGFLTEIYGWHTLYIFMTGYALLCILAIKLLLKDSYTPVRVHQNDETFILNRLRDGTTRAFAGFALLARNKQFMYGVLIHSSLFYGKWLWGTVAPFIFITSLGLNAAEFGFYSSIPIFFFIVASLFTQFTVQKLGNFKLVQIGLAVSTCGLLGLQLLAFTYPESPLLIATAAGVYLCATAMLGPAGATMSMDLAQNKGSAGSIIASSRTFAQLMGALTAGFIQGSYLLIIPALMSITVALPAVLLFKLKTLREKNSG